MWLWRNIGVLHTNGEMHIVRKCELWEIMMIAYICVLAQAQKGK